MALARRLVAMMIFCPELWCAHGEGPHPCFASEAVPPNERRFFSFAPANVRSDPPVDCVFVFGGPPGSLLRMGLYDVRTKGPPVFLGQESAKLCRSDVIRVYDFGRQGLQFRAAYCGLLRRGRMLSMSSNMAVVTYTSDNNDPGNAFSVGVDAIDIGRGTTRREITTPCSMRPTTSTATPDAIASTAASTDGGGSDTEEAAKAKRVLGDRYGDWGGASGDSESEEQGAAWYHDRDAVVAVISTGGAATPPAAKGGSRSAAVEGVEERAEVETGAAPSEEWGKPGTGELDGEETGKVVAVYSNGTGDEDEDALEFYYYL